MNEADTHVPLELPDPDNAWRTLPPSILDNPAVPPEVYAGLFSSAADLYRQAPWEMFDREIPLEVRSPENGPSHALVLLGAGGDEFGFLVYDSPSDYRKARRESDPMRMAREISWLAFTYDSADSLAEQDYGAIRNHGWQIAGERAYPIIARAGAPDVDLRPPLISDLAWLSAVLPVLSEFYNQFSPASQNYPEQSEADEIWFTYEHGGKVVKIRPLSDRG